MRSKRVARSATRWTAIVAAVKAFNTVTLLIVMFVMVGCAPSRTGATLDELNRKMGGPGGGQARIVVIRDKGFPGIFDSGWQVYLDGAAIGGLKTGTFIYRDLRAGPHKLMFSRPGDFARASTRDFSAESGRTYVFRLDLNEKGNLVYSSSVAAGLAGMLITSAASHAADERGFFDFTLLEGELAKQALADIHLTE